jgi:ATP-dependent DNA helicase RecQ
LHVRMLATPERIKRDLPGDGLEVGLLRALWKLHGDRLYDGVSLDPAGLPPGFAGSAGTLPLLESLQQRQFLTWSRSGGGLHLRDRTLTADRLPIDWELLERRRRSELNKLEMMQKYAYTPTCRREFVLRYFGDPAARGKCGGCDNCLGTHQKAGRTRAGVPKPTRDRSARSARSGATKRGSPAGVDSPALEPRDVPLYTALKRLRASMAAADKVPAYVVCSDRTLAEIAAHRPRSRATLSNINGMGPSRLEKYGERLLEVIRNVTDTEAA